MAKKKVEVGQRYGKLTVDHMMYKAGTTKYWLCICDCGNTRVVPSGGLFFNKVTMCLEEETKEKLKKKSRSTKKKT